MSETQSEPTKVIIRKPGHPAKTADEPSPDLDPTKKQTGLALLTITGIPVTKVAFQSAVRNGDGTPETNFSMEASAPTRRVKMWICPPLLVCFHKDKYFATPLANCVDLVE